MINVLIAIAGGIAFLPALAVTVILLFAGFEKDDRSDERKER